MTDAVHELRGLLEEALTVASPRDGEWILARARELADTSGSSEALLLASRIEQTVRPSLCPRPQPLSARLRQLEAELARDGDTSPSRLLDALGASGLSAAADLSPRECQEAGKLLFQPLRTLAERYRRHGGVNVEGLQAVSSELKELAAVLPDQLNSVRTEVERMRGVVSSKIGERQAEREVVELIEVLQREVVRQEHLEELDELESRLRGNLWAKQHPDDDRIAEAEDLLARLEQIAAGHVRIAGLPQRVEETLESASQSQAAAELQQAVAFAEEKQVRDRRPLETAAGLLIESFRQTCRTVESAMRDRGSISTDTLLRRLDDLARVREASRRIPEGLRQGLEPIERQIRELDREIEDRLRTESQRAEQERFESLARRDLASYVAELEASSLPGIDEWREKIVELAADLEAAEAARRPIREEVLDRLERWAEVLGETPVTRAARAAAESHRRALALCDEVGREVDAGTGDAGRRLDELEEIMASLPDWDRPRDLATRIRDADLVERIRQHAASGRPEDLDEAARLAVRLTDEMDRNRFAAAAGHLKELAVKLGRAAQDRRALEGKSEASDVSEAITRGVQAVEGLLSQEQRALDTQRILAAGWQALESESAWLMGALPGAIRRWMGSVVPAAQARDEIMVERRKFAAWLEILADEFLLDAGGRLLGRRQAEIEIDELRSQGRLPEALEVLGRHRDLLDDAIGIEGGLQRELALARWNEGDDPDLEGMAETAGRFGVDTRLAEVFVEQFRERGLARPLAALDHRGAPRLERFPVLEALARWSRSRVSRGDLEELAGRLADPATDPEALEVFVSGLGRVESGEARALGLLDRLAERGAPRSSAVAEALETASARLTERIERRLVEIASEREAARGSYEAEAYDTAQAAPRSDSALERSLRAAREEARIVLDPAATKLENLRDELAGASPWLSPRSELGRRLQLLSSALDEELDRVVRDREILAELDHVIARLLEDHEPDNAAELTEVLRGVGSRSTFVLRRVRRTATEFFASWRFVVQDFNRLLAAHETGGDGLSLRELEKLLSRLEDDHRYDFRPGQDRFHLLSRLGGTEYAAFCTQLAKMVGEVEQVEDWSARLKETVRHARRHLKSSLKKARAAVGSDDEGPVLDSLRELLDSKGMAKLFDERPRVELSTAALEKLRVVEGGTDFGMISEGVNLVRAAAGAS